MFNLSRGALKAIQKAIQLAQENRASEVSSEYLLLSIASTDTRLGDVGLTQEYVTKFILEHKDELDYMATLVEDEGDNITLPPDAGMKMAAEFDNLLAKALLLSVNISSDKKITTHTLILAMLREKNSKANYVISSAPNLDLDTFENVIIAGTMTDDDMQPKSTSDKKAKTHLTDGATSRGKGKIPKQIADCLVNLTQKGKNGELDEVFNRDDEIERAVLILSRRTKNNPILVGDPGVGKTAIVDGIVMSLLKSEAQHDCLRGREIWSLDLAAVTAGTRYRGDFEEKMKLIIDTVQASNAILFIDEIHTLIGGGKTGTNAADSLKPLLARGELRTIGATTYDEYRKYFEKDAALARRFQPVTVAEPTEAQAIAMLKNIQTKYAEYHHVSYSPEAITSAVTLSSRYIPDRRLPDKAIDLLDEAGVSVRFRKHLNPDSKKLETKIEGVLSQKETAISQENYEIIPSLLEEEKTLVEALEKQLLAEAKRKKTAPVVTGVDIANILTASTGIPVNILEEERSSLLTLEDRLNKVVISQEAAVSAVSRIVRRQRAGLKDPKRPAGSFFFAGPTGVGKTELAKALAHALFNDDSKLITLDMSEYGEKGSVARLFGAPPGYIGFEEGGQLTELVKQNPYSIVLLDEVEKAHPDVFNPLLQVLEEGRLTDGQGRIIDFKNTIIIMTSNIGASRITHTPIGFQIENDNGKNAYEVMKSKVMTELKKEFKPEFLNRLDDIIVFPALDRAGITRILDKFLGNINDRLKEHKVVVELSDKAKDYFISNGYNPDLGARPMRRLLQQQIEDPVSEILLLNSTDKDFSVLIMVDYEEGRLTYNNLTRDDLFALPQGDYNERVL